MNFDLVVIGGGPGGYVPAIRAAQYGMKTALVEAGELGGVCLNRGCVPTKSLLHAAHLLRGFKESGRFGVSVSDISFDLDHIYARKNETVKKLRAGIASLLKANKVEVVFGRAFIAEQGLVRVQKKEGGTQAFRTANTLIATGSAPTRPPIPGIDLPGVITSDALLNSPPDFKSLLIIGGGVIGVEMASVFSAFGSVVTIIESLDRILPAFDREISQNLTAILKKRGVSVITGANITGIQKNGDSLLCIFEKNGVSDSLSADRVLAATGRAPCYSDLFGASLAVNTARGILADDNFETSVKGIFAVGDVKEGGVQLAHAASAEGLRAVAYMAGKDFSQDLTAVPFCVYTDPEIAAVGLTADDAKRLGFEVKTGKYLMASNARSIIEGAQRGFIKLVFNAADDTLIGAHLMCERATDLISVLAEAKARRLTSKELFKAVSAHPTFVEGLTEAAEGVTGLAIHILP